MVRLYVLSTNFGQGWFGFTFCPIAKSDPEPEYSTVFSDPIALVALSITVFASCAKAIVYISIVAAIAAVHFLLILPPSKTCFGHKKAKTQGGQNSFVSFVPFCGHSPFHTYGSENATTESVAIAATYCLPFLP